jgi:hypothetical protein
MTTLSVTKYIKNQQVREICERIRDRRFVRTTLFKIPIIRMPTRLERALAREVLERLDEIERTNNE